MQVASLTCTQDNKCPGGCCDLAPGWSVRVVALRIGEEAFAGTPQFTTHRRDGSGAGGYSDVASAHGGTSDACIAAVSAADTQRWEPERERV